MANWDERGHGHAHGGHRTVRRRHSSGFELLDGVAGTLLALSLPLIVVVWVLLVLFVSC